MCECYQGYECEQIKLTKARRFAGAVRLYVVLDTSVLLSHWSFIQALHRNLGQDGAVRPDQAGSPAPAVQLVLVVPWAVLVELDKLKEERSVLRIQGTCACFLLHYIAGILMMCHLVSVSFRVPGSFGCLAE